MNLGTHKYTINKKEYLVNSGYDARMDYAFMVIFNKDKDILYSNMGEENVFEIKDFVYFLNKAMKDFNIDLSDINYAIELFLNNKNQSLDDYKSNLLSQNLDKFAKTVSY